MYARILCVLFFQCIRVSFVSHASVYPCVLLCVLSILVSYVLLRPSPGQLDLYPDLQRRGGGFSPAEVLPAKRACDLEIMSFYAAEKLPAERAE